MIVHGEELDFILLVRGEAKAIRHLAHKRVLIPQRRVADLPSALARLADGELVLVRAYFFNKPTLHQGVEQSKNDSPAEAAARDQIAQRQHLTPRPECDEQLRGMKNGFYDVWVTARSFSMHTPLEISDFLSWFGCQLRCKNVLLGHWGREDLKYKVSLRLRCI